MMYEQEQRKTTQPWAYSLAAWLEINISLYLLYIRMFDIAQQRKSHLRHWMGKAIRSPAANFVCNGFSKGHCLVWWVNVNGLGWGKHYKVGRVEL